MIVNISDAKAQLSRLIDRVYHGEKVVIAKNNLPIADLVPHIPEGALVLKSGLAEASRIAAQSSAYMEWGQCRQSGT